MGIANVNAHHLTVKEWEDFSSVGNYFTNGLIHYDKDGVIITNGKVLMLLDTMHLPVKFGNCVPIYKPVDGIKGPERRTPKAILAIAPFVFAPDDNFVEMKPAKTKCGQLVTFEPWNGKNKVQQLPMSAIDNREDIFTIINRRYYDIVKKLFCDIKFWAARIQNESQTGAREMNHPLYVTANDGEFRAVIMPMASYDEFQTIVALCKATAGLRHD